MRDWKRYVREHLPALNVEAAREREIVEELAQQLEQEFAQALARGVSADEAELRAKSQISDWEALGRDIVKAERPIASEVARCVPVNWQPQMAEVQLRKWRGGMMVADLIQDAR